MKKRRWMIAVCASMLAGVIGCGNKEAEPMYPVSQAVSDYEDAKKETGQEDRGASAEISAETLRAGINRFAYRMYGELGEQENIFFSPYSLCSALALLDVGADSATKEELEELLGITDLDAWNAAMKSYLDKEWSDDTFVITANAIWMDENKEFAPDVEKDFLRPVGYYYGCEVYQADLKGNPTDATGQMNSWADKNTRGMIPKITDTLPDDTVMALLNAVYFEGKWETQFKKENTAEETFYGTTGDSTVQMMHQYDAEYAYVERDGMKGISLPYKDANIVMKVFIPLDETEDITALFAALDDEKKEELLDSLDGVGTKKISRLALPRFTMEKEIDGLEKILQDMGMVAAFRPDAGFDKIGVDLYVSGILHKAKIEVDEEGTKAAAVTEVMVSDSAFSMEEIIEFVADRPFVYVLQDTETGMILFMGRVNNL